MRSDLVTEHSRYAAKKGLHTSGEKQKAVTKPTQKISLGEHSKSRLVLHSPDSVGSEKAELLGEVMTAARRLAAIHLPTSSSLDQLLEWFRCFESRDCASLCLVFWLKSMSVSVLFLLRVACVEGKSIRLF